MKCCLDTTHALWELEGVGVSVPLHSRTDALLSDHTHTHTSKDQTTRRTLTVPLNKPSWITSFGLLSYSTWQNIVCSSVTDAHPPSFPESPIVAVCVLVARSWMKERSPCGLLPSDPLLSMKQEIMAEGPRCKRRKQANPRRKNGKKAYFVEKLNCGVYLRL